VLLNYFCWFFFSSEKHNITSLFNGAHSLRDQWLIELCQLQLGQCLTTRESSRHIPSEVFEIKYINTNVNHFANSQRRRTRCRCFLVTSISMTPIGIKQRISLEDLSEEDRSLTMLKTTSSLTVLLIIWKIVCYYLTYFPFE